MKDRKRDFARNETTKRKRDERKNERERRKKKQRGSIPRVLAGRLGGGKFNFDPVDSAVIPKFNL